MQAKSRKYSWTKNAGHMIQTKHEKEMEDVRPWLRHIKLLVRTLLSQQELRVFSPDLWPFMSSHSEAEDRSQRATLSLLKDSCSVSCGDRRRQAPETPTSRFLQIYHSSFQCSITLPESLPGSGEAFKHFPVYNRPVLRILSTSAGEVRPVNRLWRWVCGHPIWEVTKLRMPLLAQEVSFREFTQNRADWGALSASSSPPPSLQLFRWGSGDQQRHIWWKRKTQSHSWDHIRVFSPVLNTALCLIQLFHPSQPSDPKSTWGLDSALWVHPLLCFSEWLEELSHVFLGYLLS